MSSRKSAAALAEDMSNLSKRQVETRRQLAYRHVVQIMKSNMWVCTDVEQYLGDVGLKIVDGAVESAHGDVTVESRATEKLGTRLEAEGDQGASHEQGDG